MQQTHRPNERATDPKVQRIIRWRESMATLNDERFFEIMRIYIGEIRTPFNKDKLIEQLSGILRKEQNREKIIAYLSDFDIKMISAVHVIKDATKEKIAEFFRNEYPLGDIYSELLNLSERLILFTYKNEDARPVIALNPILEETLLPYMNVRSLVPEPIFAEHNFDAPFALSPQFIASFIAYVYENPELCKNNSSFKKKDAERLEAIFPGKSNVLNLLLAALINLKLFKQTEKEISIDEKRFAVFLKNSQLRQYAFLSVASAARLGREGLRSQCQLLLDVAASCPAQGVSRSSLSRLAFLINSRTHDQNAAPVQGRFSRMLESHAAASRPEFEGHLTDQILDNAIALGIFAPLGKTEDGELIVAPGAVITNKETPLPTAMKKGILNINAVTTITILPGLSLEELFPLVQFMNIKNCSTVTEFELSRRSVSRAFDKNISSAQILALLGAYNSYKIPESLEMNLEEWESQYSSAVLYRGYVLKVDEKRERVILSNPRLTPFIQEQLAPGIFLLSIPIDQAPDEFIQNSGIEFIGSVKNTESAAEVINYPPLKNGENYFDGADGMDGAATIGDAHANSRSDGEEFKRELLKKVESMQLSKQQQEGLCTRIRRNVILSEEQLKPETVRVEILEADGMNYAGKIHLLENAISGGDFIEFSIPNERNSAVTETYLGQPLMLSKQANDSLLKLQIQDKNENSEIRFFSVSRASHIKIIRTSLFK